MSSPPGKLAAGSPERREWTAEEEKVGAHERGKRQRVWLRQREEEEERFVRGRRRRGFDHRNREGRRRGRGTKSKAGGGIGG